MTALRQLSVLYLAAASSFTVAIVLSQHPLLNKAAHETASDVGEGAGSAAVALNDYVIQPSWSFAKAETSTLYRVAMDAIHPPVQVAQAPAKPIAIAQAKHRAPQPPAFKPLPVPKLQAPERMIAEAGPPLIATAPAAPQVRPSELRPAIAEPAPASPPAKPDRDIASNTTRDFTLVPQATQPYAPAPISKSKTETARALPSVDHPPSDAQLAFVAQHLRESLTKEMLANFELFLFISKADHGSAAQRMYVFEKQDGGDLALLYNWPVSTGRELDEIAPNGLRAPSITPAGYYELDPHRMYLHHFSGQWHQPMPYAMFFNWEKNGLETGLAIHGASGDDIGLLGRRASAGCIHLAPENARVLFSLIKNDYKGLMPKFAYDKRTATMSNQGVLLHSTDGRLEMAEGYKVLVFIEDYGGENVVAALF